VTVFDGNLWTSKGKVEYFVTIIVVALSYAMNDVLAGNEHLNGGQTKDKEPKEQYSQPMITRCSEFVSIPNLPISPF
jgi:hypothetical protein